MTVMLESEQAIGLVEALRESARLNLEALERLEGSMTNDESNPLGREQSSQPHRPIASQRPTTMNYVQKLSDVLSEVGGPATIRDIQQGLRGNFSLSLTRMQILDLLSRNSDVFQMVAGNRWRLRSR